MTLLKTASRPYRLCDSNILLLVKTIVQAKTMSFQEPHVSVPLMLLTRWANHSDSQCQTIYIRITALNISDSITDSLRSQHRFMLI